MFNINDLGINRLFNPIIIQQFYKIVVFLKKSSYVCIARLIYIWLERPTTG